MIKKGVEPKKTRGERLFFASIVISFLSILSMAFGLIRNSLFASYFGSSSATDAYYIAYNTIHIVVSSISSSLVSIFYPYYAERKNISPEDGKRFTTGFVTLVLYISIILAVCFTTLAPVLVHVLAPTYTNEKYELTVSLFRGLSLLPILFMLNGIFGAILNINKKYVGVQVRGVIGNILSITIIILCWQTIGIYAMVLSTLASILIQCVLLFISVARLQRIDIKPKLITRDILRTLRGLIPLTGGIVLTQIQVVVDNTFASSLQSGSVSAINYAATIMSFMLILSYTPITSVMHPEILERINDTDSLRSALSKGICMMIVLIIPCTTGVVLLKKDIISILYFRGNFDQSALTITSSVLGVYVLGTMCNCIMNYYSFVFNAKKEYIVSVVTGSIELLINIAGNILLIKPLGVIGLAISTSVAHFIHVIIKIIWLQKRHKCVDVKDLLLTSLKVISASIVMYLCGEMLIRICNFQSQYIRLISVILFCIPVYALLIKLFKVEEYDFIANAMTKRFRKKA